MSKIESIKPDLGPAVRLLRDDELEAVNGGIMIIGGLGGPDTHNSSAAGNVAAKWSLTQGAAA